MNKCTKCGRPGVKTEWRPPEGIAPELRQYRCPEHWDVSWFLRTGRLEHVKRRQRSSA